MPNRPFDIRICRKDIKPAISISEDVLWLIVMNYLPQLEKQIEKLLGTKSIENKF